MPASILKSVLSFAALIADSSNTTEEEEEEEEESVDGDESFDFLYDLGLITWIVPFISILIVTLLTKRKALCPKCLHGYFGLAVPVNFLEERKRRKPVIAAFALIAMDILELIESMGEISKGQRPAIKILIKLALVAYVSCTVFPLFACIYMGTLPGYIYGLMYHIYYILYNILELFPQPGLAKVALIKHILLRSIVLIIAGSFLFYWFIKKIIVFFIKNNRTEDIPRNQIKYVKTLFLPKERYLEIQETGKLKEASKSKFVQWFRRKIYHSIPGFRYSLTILVSCTLGFLVITHISIMVFYKMIKNVSEVLHLLDKLVSLKTFKVMNFVEFIVTSVTPGHSSDTEKRSDGTQISVYEFIYYQSMIVLVGTTLAGIITYILSIFSICRLLTNYRENVLNLSKQKTNQQILEIKDPSSYVTFVRSALQYGGYQVAYITAGFSIQLLSFNIFFFLLGELIVLPIQFAFWSFVTYVAERAAPIIIALLLIQLTQFLLIKFFFLEDRGKTMALQNRRGFFIMSYFVYFYNIFTGVFSCAKRIIIGSIYGIFLVPRLDTSIFPSIFQKSDSGFKAYSCLLRLEALQSNPIVRTFVCLVIKSQNKSENDCSNHMEKEAMLLESKTPSRNPRAKTRWFVAYTLVRNPSIIFFRGHFNVLNMLDSSSKLEPNVELVTCI